jgi:pimeloyl-ACP methyl ester carboxylesterase
MNFDHDEQVEAAHRITVNSLLSTPPLNLWHGFAKEEWSINGRDCILVRPQQPAATRLWIWRTEFFGHEPQADIALLERGFHVAYMDVQDMYGAPIAMRHMSAFYEHLTRECSLSPRVTLEGFSRGGLFALNWAIANPDKVACLYLDAPVCDIKSWPAGLGASAGSPNDWEKCKAVYGLTQEQAVEYANGPLNNLQPLAQARIPILCVCGAADTVVPMAENTDVLEERYRALSGPITVLAKPDCEHHPHSFEDPTPIVEFVVANAANIL